LRILAAHGAAPSTVLLRSVAAAIAVGGAAVTMARLPHRELGHLPFGSLPFWSRQRRAYQASMNRAVIVAGDRRLLVPLGRFHHVL
jgi:hypothetical protein